MKYIQENKNKTIWELMMLVCNITSLILGKYFSQDCGGFLAHECVLMSSVIFMN